MTNIWLPTLELHSIVINWSIYLSDTIEISNVLWLSRESRTNCNISLIDLSSLGLLVVQHRVRHMATTKLVQHSGRFYGHICLTLSVYVACVSGSEWVLSFVNIENAAALTPKRIRSNSGASRPARSSISISGPRPSNLDLVLVTFGNLRFYLVRRRRGHVIHSLRFAVVVAFAFAIYMPPRTHVECT